MYTGHASTDLAMRDSRELQDIVEELGIHQQRRGAWSGTVSG
jgi:hypothetical protein